ncbi:MAG TPA: response regulator transcription factor [Pyrinomonadaceae bacterium]|nr:response regulator transcription factor [Pyrinomonadaceae bacterium]
MEQKSILIADDHPIFRSGLRSVIVAEPSFEVVGEASDGEEAMELLAKQPVDILILDYNMPKLTGFAVLQKIAEQKIDVIPVMLTMHNDEAMFAKAFELGVRGYVLKDSASVDIVNCLHAVSQGQVYTSAAVTTYLYKRASRGQESVAGLGSLTPAERKVLRMIADYKTSREIADELCVSIRTVENHRSNISSKLGVTGSHGLFKFAIQHQSDLL